MKAFFLNDNFNFRHYSYAIIHGQSRWLRWGFVKKFFYKRTHLGNPNKYYMISFVSFQQNTPYDLVATDYVLSYFLAPFPCETVKATYVQKMRGKSHNIIVFLRVVSRDLECNHVYINVYIFIHLLIGYLLLHTLHMFTIHNMINNNYIMHSFCVYFCGACIIHDIVYVGKTLFYACWPFSWRSNWLTLNFVRWCTYAWDPTLSLSACLCSRRPRDL